MQGRQENHYCASTPVPKLEGATTIRYNTPRQEPKKCLIVLWKSKNLHSEEVERQELSLGSTRAGEERHSAVDRHERSLRNLPIPVGVRLSTLGQDFLAAQLGPRDIAQVVRARVENGNYMRVS